MGNIDLLREIREFLIQNTSNYKISELKFWEEQGVTRYSHYFYIILPGLFGKKIAKIQFYDSVNPKERSDIELVMLDNSVYKQQIDEIQKVLAEFKLKLSFVGKID